MYFYPDQIDLESKFFFDGKIIENYIWAELPSAAKSVFPVIGAFSNNRGHAYPSERTIAILSGRTEKTARSGVEALDGIISLSHYTTELGRRAKKYIMQPSPENSAFPFHRCLLEKGLWQHLTPSAQALYPVMRHFGYFDFRTLASFTSCKKEDFSQVAKERDYDFCEESPDNLTRLAGISKQSLGPALDRLISCDLIRSQDKDPGGLTYLWKVHFKTESWFPRQLLNTQISARYGIG